MVEIINYTVHIVINFGASFNRVKSAGESQLQQNATLCDPMSLNFKAYNRRVIG